MLNITCTGSVTEVVTPHIGWDGDGPCVEDVGARTYMLTTTSDDLMKSSCKSPDVFPGITSMCEANTFHIVVINCEMTIIVVRPECIWCLLLVANGLTTHVCVSYAMKVEGCRGAATSINILAQSLFGVVSSFSPAGHVWLLLVMLILATLIQPPVIPPQDLLMSQYM